MGCHVPPRWGQLCSTGCTACGGRSHAWRRRRGGGSGPVATAAEGFPRIAGRAAARGAGLAVGGSCWDLNSGIRGCRDVVVVEPAPACRSTGCTRGSSEQEFEVRHLVLEFPNFHGSTSPSIDLLCLNYFLCSLH